jgi:hypothetical protein
VSRPPRTLVELCVARGGPLKGARVGAFIASWALASHAQGGPIGLDEYADYWAEPMSTAYRHQARFREMFPGQSTPQLLADELIRAYEADLLKRGVGGLLQRPAPSLALAA